MSDIYLKTNSDGVGTEGIGAMAQYQIHAYAISKINNIKYAFFGFKNFQHYQNNLVTQQQFCEDINNFFNFPNELNNNVYDVYELSSISNISLLKEQFKNHDRDIVLELPSSLIMPHADSNIHNENYTNHIKNLRKNLYIKEDKKYFDKNTKNIAIHIRVKNNFDICNSQSREYFLESDKYKILNILSQSIKKFFNNEKVSIHVYSQGLIENFEFINILKNENIQIIFHIEEYPIISLYHMIESDLLIMSNSSFSYIAHLFSNNICLTRKSFYHNTCNENKYFFDGKGNIL